MNIKRYALVGIIIGSIGMAISAGILLKVGAFK